MDHSLPTLIVISGPTAVGKTSFAIDLATKLNSCIVSCDSRQFYKELNIGTAKPSLSELERVKHFFIGHLSIHDYYNISRFESDVLSLLNSLFLEHKVVLMVGGSGLYIDAVCKGVDSFPDPPAELRNNLKAILKEKGIEEIRKMLLVLDPEYYEKVDLMNPNRLLRALEVCISSGQPYSAQRLNMVNNRPFNILKIALNLPREILFDRINKRVDIMIEDGLLQEAKQMKDLRHLNALNTVGYKELFSYLDNEISLSQAITDIKTNTRRYAKRQLTWMHKDNEYKWYQPDQLNEVVKFVVSQLQ